jgi:hypothetical protein
MSVGVFSLLTEALRVFPESLSRVKDFNFVSTTRLELSLVDRGEYPDKFRFGALEEPYRGSTIPDYGRLRFKDCKTELKTSYHYPDIQHSPLTWSWLAYCNTP